MSLAFTDDSTNQVSFGSAAGLDNIAEGTVLLWVYPTSVANTLREVVSKSASGGPNGWNVFKRGSNGTIWALQASRATAHQFVDVTGMVANEWQFIAYSWNIASGGPKSYRGTLSAIATDISGTPVNGSGAQADDSAANLCVGARSGAVATCAPMRVGWVAVYNRALTLAEVQSLQFSLRSLSGNQLSCVIGYGGTSTQPDWSGNGNNGSVSGATVADHVPVMFRRQGQLYVPYAVAAAGGSALLARLQNEGLFIGSGGMAA
jgi:concanavalin A-like lectin/glucanase superfamily protein